MSKIEIILVIAKNGLGTAVALLKNQKTRKATKLARLLASAETGIQSYLDDLPSQ